MKTLFLLILLGAGLASYAEDNTEEVFTDIYETSFWGEGSGTGADFVNARLYVAYVQYFLGDTDVGSVVDVGCGDWRFSRHIDWSGIRYLGYDVVESVVASNQERYGSPTVGFVHENGVLGDLPPADLLICKDVLQHLPNDDVMSLLSQLSKFKYCLLTNDVNPSTFTAENCDIPRGGHRPIDLTKPPFNVKGKKVMAFLCTDGSMKQVLLVEVN